MFIFCCGLLGLLLTAVKRQPYCSLIFLTHEIPFKVQTLFFFFFKCFQLLYAVVVRLELMYAFVFIQHSVKSVEVCT